MLIGRTAEQKILRQAFHSARPEFVAVYGRRRVGKTYLIRETFKDDFTFTHTGLAQRNTREQLQNFTLSLRHQGLPKVPQPANWLEAFDLLTQLVRQSTARRKVLFIDELPWLDAPRSGFVAALEHFWNGFASARDDVMLIVCGSATSWIIKKIVNNHGGLHNRLTCSIHLQPFTLNECEQYARHLKLGLNRRQILEGYMALGGVPYYWSLLDRENSLTQNIDALFFARHGTLRDEFRHLYASLFQHPDKYIAIIKALGRKKAGMTRAEIVIESKVTDNGRLTTMLEDLESCGFIRRYPAIGQRTKHAVFQLIDQYTLFYFKFIGNSTVNDEHYWSKVQGTPLYNTWCGLAFERLCLLHSRQIKEALGIGGVISSEYAWRVEGDHHEQGAQIDLLIDRSDGVINLCEIKYSKSPFRIDAKYDRALQHKAERFVQATKTRKAIRITLITTQGTVRNAFSDDIPNKITVEELFRP